MPTLQAVQVSEPSFSEEEDFEDLVGDSKSSVWENDVYPSKLAPAPELDLYTAPTHHSAGSLDKSELAVDKPSPKSVVRVTDSCSAKALSDSASCDLKDYSSPLKVSTKLSSPAPDSISADKISSLASSALAAEPEQEKSFFAKADDWYAEGLSKISGGHLPLTRLSPEVSEAVDATVLTAVGAPLVTGTVAPLLAKAGTFALRATGLMVDAERMAAPLPGVNPWATRAAFAGGATYSAISQVADQAFTKLANGEAPIPDLEDISPTAMLMSAGTAGFLASWIHPAAKIIDPTRGIPTHLKEWLTPARASIWTASTEYAQWVLTGSMSKVSELVSLSAGVGGAYITLASRSVGEAARNSIKNFAPNKQKLIDAFPDQPAIGKTVADLAGGLHLSKEVYKASFPYIVPGALLTGFAKFTTSEGEQTKLGKSVDAGLDAGLNAAVEEWNKPSTYKPAEVHAETTSNRYTTTQLEIPKLTTNNSPSQSTASLPSAQPTFQLPPDEIGTYTVQPGDNLSTIAQTVYRRGSSYSKVFAANKDLLSNPDKIQPGQVLHLPLPSGKLDR